MTHKKITKSKLQSALKAQGVKLPHGYEVVTRKKVTTKKKK